MRCMWKYLNQNDRHLLLTGSRGAGKSTLMRQLAGWQGGADGILTQAVRQPDGSAMEVQLRRMGREEFCIIGKGGPQGMQPVKAGFTRGAELLRQCREQHAGLLVIDEIGFLEQQQVEFLQEIWNCFEKTRVWAVLRKGEYPFQQRLKARGDVWVVDLDHWQEIEWEQECSNGR